MFLCIHTNNIHTDIKHTTEQIKKINAISQFVVRNEYPLNRCNGSL